MKTRGRERTVHFSTRARVSEGFGEGRTYGYRLRVEVGRTESELATTFVSPSLRASRYGAASFARLAEPKLTLRVSEGWWT